MDATLLRNTLVSSLIAAAVLLLVLWPTRNSGARLLRTWGIPVPTAPQVAEAVGYLRRRRVLAVALFVAVPQATRLWWPDAPSTGTSADILVPLLAAMVIAELVAVLRPARGPRTASLNPRSWRDLVPRWAVAVTAVLTALAVGTAVAGLLASGPGGATAAPAGWPVLTSTAACLAVVLALVHLAVRRPAVADPAVDRALRTRTARVGVAIGFGWLAASVTAGAQGLGRITLLGDDRPAGPAVHQVLEIAAFVVFVAAVACWMWLAMPGRRSLAR